MTGLTTSTKATSSPAPCDSVSCTKAIDRMRRTDSSMACLASGLSSRRPCSRSSDEIVCRLFFTRWWISRIVASLDSSSRSRRRSSEMSRSSTTAPLAAPRSSSGMHRISTTTSLPRDSSSVTGEPVANAVRTTFSSRPSSPSRRPSAVGVNAERCSVDTAFGEAYSTRPDESSTITPSPTRGASLVSASSVSNGKSPSEIMRAKRLNTST